MEIYKKYLKSCTENSTQLVSSQTFKVLFCKLNFAIHHPKKDQCDACISHKTGISRLPNTIYEEKTEARMEEKIKCMLSAIQRQQ